MARTASLMKVAVRSRSQQCSAGKATGLRRWPHLGRKMKQRASANAGSLAFGFSARPAAKARAASSATTKAIGRKSSSWLSGLIRFYYYITIIFVLSLLFLSWRFREGAGAAPRLSSPCPPSAFPSDCRTSRGPPLWRKASPWRTKLCFAFAPPPFLLDRGFALASFHDTPPTPGVPCVV
jgi:hypothetical protein